MKMILVACLLISMGAAHARSYDEDDYYESRGQISIGSDGLRLNIGPTYREREYRGNREPYQRCWRRNGQLICKEVDNRQRRYDEYRYDDGRW